MAIGDSTAKAGSWLPALLALGLGGCMATGVPYRQDAAVVPPDVSFRMDDGAVLPGRVWRAEGMERAVVVALHGFGDSRDAWEHAAPRLAAQGLTVYAYDQRGFGAGPGRGHWAGTGRMVEDAAEVAADVQRAAPGVPLYVMGESMGGAVAMVLMAGDAPARHGVAVSGTILLAPAVWGRGQMNPLVLAALDVADTFAPGHHLTGREIALHIRASDDRAELVKLSRDPLTLSGSSVSMLSGLVDLMTRAQDDAARLRGPVLICYGAHDELVPAAATAAAWSKLPAQDRRAYYANGFHLELRDLDHRAVETDMVSWIEHPDWPLPSGGDLLASGWVASRAWAGGAPYPLPEAFDDVGGPTRAHEDAP